MSIWSNKATQAGVVTTRAWNPANPCNAQRGHPDAAYGPRAPIGWSRLARDNATRYSEGYAAANLGLGAAALAPQFGQITYNPIGAGIVAVARPQASYGMAGQYIANQIFWAPQTIPTSIPLGPLASAQTLAALLGTVNVQAVLPVA